MTPNLYLMGHGQLIFPGTLKLFNEPLPHLLNADDLVLLSTSKEALTNCMSQLESHWQLKINNVKSKILAFNGAEKILSGSR